MQNFSERLEIAIEKSKRPKGELAAHCGVALSTVSRWLAGSVPKAETLELIAEFLSVEAKWLVFGGDAKPYAGVSKWMVDDPAVLREDPIIPIIKPPLREPGEPSLMDRVENLQRAYAETREELAEANRKLDALIDLLKGRETP